MNDVIVTIGRENGSGGREVGRILADLMGVRCYDREIIEATAAKTGLSIEEVERSEENRSRSPFYFWGGGYLHPTPYSKVSPKQSPLWLPRAHAFSWEGARITS